MPTYQFLAERKLEAGNMTTELQTLHTTGVPTRRTRSPRPTTT
jgi:cbb3-type cytochrome oxidase cytochrome c subunit